MDLSNPQIIQYAYILVFIGIFYFFLIRPQQKQAKNKKLLIDSLNVKDKIVTIGGIYGTIMKVKENSIVLKIAEKVEIEILKSSVGFKQNYPE